MHCRAAVLEGGTRRGRVGAHNSVVGADQGFRARSWDQDSVREDSASAPSRQVNDHGRVSGTHRLAKPFGVQLAPVTVDATPQMR